MSVVDRAREDLETELRELRRRLELKELRERSLTLRREIVDKMASLATAAFGLVAALAWNNAIQALFRRFYPAPDDPAALWPLVGYAVLVTVVAVLVILWVSRVAGRLKREEKAAEKADAARG